MSYCSPQCQSKDHAATHGKECSNFGRYMSRDVGVRLSDNGGEEPEWLKLAMDHQCDESYCEQLERLGVHDNAAYRLLCGCQGAPSPHRALIDPIPGTIDEEPAVVHDNWLSYYRARGLPLSSPIAVLLSFPLTLYHILMHHLQHAPAGTTDPPALGTARGSVIASIWVRIVASCVVLAVISTASWKTSFHAGDSSSKLTGPGGLKWKMRRTPDEHNDPRFPDFW